MGEFVIAQESGKISGKQGELGVKLSFAPISAGVAGAGGMMGPYHVADLQHNRISNVVAVYDLENTARDIAGAYGVPMAFFFKEEKGSEAYNTRAFNAFLNTHLLTVISGPNNVHAPQAEAILSRSDADKRFIYTEKPSSNSLEGAIRLAQLEQEHPGQIGVVSQNRMWDMLLEAKHMIANGAIGKMQYSEIEYQQDWMNPGTPTVWRTLKGIGGELGPDNEGNLGKLIDIIYHAIDTLMFVTGQKVSSVINAYIQNHVSERVPGGGGPFGAKVEASGKVRVGGDSPFHGDDVINSLVELENGAKAQVIVSQTNAGHKNMLRFRVYGENGSIEFNTDNANEMVVYGFSAKRTVITRSSGDLTYPITLPNWYHDGMRTLMKVVDEGKGLELKVGGPFEYHTPPKHDMGWRDAHKKQALALALYAQLVTNGLIDKSERNKLYVVPTAFEAFTVMRVMKSMYETAAKQKDQKLAVSYNLPNK